jgi:hypothetical protein
MNIAPYVPPRHAGEGRQPRLFFIGIIAAARDQKNKSLFGSFSAEKELLPASVI